MVMVMMINSLVKIIALLIWLNTLTPRQNGHYFAAKKSKAFSLMKIFIFWLKFHWNLFPWFRSNQQQQKTLVQYMALHWTGNKPQSEPIIVSLLTHKHQWVNTWHFREWTRSHFTNILWVHNWNLLKNSLCSTLILKIQWNNNLHLSWHMTCANLWHDRVIIFPYEIWTISS